MSQVSVSELFQEYEADFRRLCAEGLALAHGQELQEAEKRFNRAEQAVKQMEMEARAMPPESRQKLQAKIKECRHEISDGRRVHKEAVNRSILFDDHTLVGKPEEDVNRSMLEASRKLAEAKRTVLESEQIGIDVMGDLRQQREVITRSRENMGKVGQNYGMAGKMLDGMLQRADQNRRMVCMIAGLFLFMLVFAFYFLASG
ncbi:unnamed protein product [Effrenium voratum]|uniref:Vesicle transport v-SNARE N-terminal domain-containing protein n=1 Tax=Effrenium voratum TaxID=2562239 RepID=A0AA36NHN6_9DINO|nr:unnamed protein product [Effrenium voratum]CAJ1438511.1 unnamed protein product [Effrenium voratum]